MERTSHTHTHTHTHTYIQIFFLSGNYGDMVLLMTVKKLIMHAFDRGGI